MLRRFSIQAKRHLPFVLDYPYITVQAPIDGPCLTDVSWKTFLDTKRFAGKLHEPAQPNASAICAVSATLRTFALAPTTAIIGNKTTCIWAPFLVDTGSRQTYFCKHTRDILRMDISDSVSVLGTPLQWASSSDHFEDINLLGSDVLGSGVLHVDYPKMSMSFNVTKHVSMLGNAIPAWVQQRDASGKAVGRAFEVTPAKNHIDALTKAIKAELEANKSIKIDALSMTIYAPDATSPAKPSLALAETTDEKPFFFVLP